MSHRIDNEQVGGREVIRLRDEATGSSASVLPSVGFNLFGLELPVAGRVRPIVATEAGWVENPLKPTRQGVPILFPFPNRIAGAQYTFEGREYELVANKGPHAIHGFTPESAWEVVDRGASEERAWAIGRFQISRQAPEALGRWPSDAAIEVRYTLEGRRLTLDATVTNPGTGPLPWGFGIHPYFRLPFRPGGDASRTKVVLPASETWVLADSIPTGERKPVEGRLDFRAGQVMAGLAVDDVLTGLHFEGERCVCRLIDQSLNAEFRLSFGREFRDLVVFTPPWLAEGGIIAVEPYTMTTDAVHLQPRGIDAGLQVLPPGGSSSMRIEFATADLT